MDSSKFFSFSKEKALISVLLPLFWLLLPVIIQFFRDLFRPEDIPPLFVPLGVEQSASLITIIGGYFLFSLFSYPLACMLVHLYEEKKKKGSSKVLNTKNIFLLVLFAIIFNPFTLTLILILLSFLLFFIFPPGDPCAVLIVDVIEGSPADIAGLQGGEKLVSLNGIDFGGDLEAILKYLLDYSVGDVIVLETESGVYEVTVGEHPEGGYGFIGFILNVAYCK